MDRFETAVDSIARSCISVRLRLLNRVVTNLFDEALRPFKLKTAQMNILVVVAKFGVAHPAEVCEFLKLDASTLSRNVERMRANGWLEIVPGDDARAQPFRLTAQGKRLIEKTVTAWEKAQRQAKDLLGDQAVAALDQAVKRARSKKSGG